MNKKRAEPNYNMSWPEEGKTCMDYLHRDVKDDEYQAACYYECARLSPDLRKMAELRKQYICKAMNDPSFKSEAKGDTLFRRIELQVREEVPSATHIGFVNSPFDWLWQQDCSFFPEKSWNRLEPGERKVFLQRFPLEKVQPLRMDEIWLLGSNRILDKLKSKAEKSLELLKEREKDLHLPLITDGALMFALFTIDFSKTKTRLREEFEAWLDLPRNKDRLQNYLKEVIGTAKRFKTLLKHLAVVRLHKKYGFNGMLDYTHKNRKKGTNGNDRPFYDSREDQTQTGRVPLNQAPVCSEESYCLKAMANIEAFLEEKMPWQFPPPLQDRNILDEEALSQKMREKKDKVSEFLWSKWPDETREFLTNYTSTQSICPGELAGPLLKGLNYVVKHCSIWDPDAFKRVKLSTEIRDLVRRNPDGKERERLNVLLLQAAFPDEIQIQLMTFGEIAARAIYPGCDLGSGPNPP